MAATDLGARLTELHGRQQAAVGADTVLTLQRLFPSFDLSTFAAIEASWPALEAALTALIAENFAVSSGLALNYYELFRAAEEVAGRTAPVLAEVLPVEQVATNLRVTGPYTAKHLVAIKDPQASEKTFVRLAGALRRLVSTGGRDTILRNVAEDKVALGWMRVTSSRNPCSFCRLLATRGAVYKTRSSAGFKAHDHCVVGSTLVRGPSAEAAFRRWYQGELIIIGTAAGDELAITPNHPVLTQRGWVDAGRLSESDYLVHRTNAQRLASGVPHENEVPARIEDAWRAYRVDGLRSMPVAAQDFHGDGVGTQGDVHVVAPNGCFPTEIDPASVELGAETLGTGANWSAVADQFFGSGDLLGVLVGATATANCVMCGSGLSGPLFGRERRQMQAIGSLAIASLHPGVLEPTSYRHPRDVVELCETFLRPASSDIQINQIGGDGQLGGGRAAHLGSRFDPPTLEDEAERVLVHANLGRRLLERLSGQVELRRLGDLRRVSYSGHVFNLRTSEGWYDANSLVVSNCHCYPEAVFRPDAPLYPSAEADLALYYEATAGYSGKDAINAFRRSVEALYGPSSVA